MTQEEKAKRYDEAYRFAEGIHRFSSNLAEIKRMEEIFPALKESEDERIRGAIIDHLKDNNLTEWAVWLEKQGAQKPFDYENANIPQKDFAPKSAMEAIKEEKVDNANKVEPKFKVGDKITEKDFDECGCGIIIDIKDGKYIFDNGGFIYIEEQGLWKLVEQKPSEWNEDDTLQLNEAIEAVNESSYLSKRKDVVINWLKSLKDKVQPQPKQEWGEEDKDKYEAIVAIIRQKYDGTNIEEKKYYNTLINWLKSLKPQNTWKPSEEQMAALNAITVNGCISYTGQGQDLAILYNDLKKLMEE